MGVNYPDSVVDDAFSLYLKGFTAEKIARELKENQPTITAGVIRKWKKKYDWDSKRADFRQEKITQTIQVQLDEIGQVRANIQLMLKAGMNAMLDQFGNAIVNPRSLEGLMIAIDKIQNTLLKIEESQKNNFDPTEFFRIIYECMTEITELRAVFSDSNVRDKFYKLLKLKTENRLNKAITIR
jgi:hypothetical protein